MRSPPVSAVLANGVGCTARGFVRLLPRLCNDGIITTSTSVVGELAASTSWTVDNIYEKQVVRNKRHSYECDVLCLSLRPLLALRIDFREWDTLLLGTARTMAGRRSRRGWSIGNARLNGDWDTKRAGVNAGRVNHGRRNAEKNERV